MRVWKYSSKTGPASAPRGLLVWRWTQPEPEAERLRDPSPIGSRTGTGIGATLKAEPMIFSKDYVGYLARQAVKHLVAAKVIKTDKPAAVDARVTAALIEELSLEDRINEEVRVILETIQDDMLKGGVSYPEMFKKVKQKLVAQYKVVL